MTRDYPDLDSASGWSCQVGNLFQPIRSSEQICVVTRHQYGFLRKCQRFLSNLIKSTLPLQLHGRRLWHRASSLENLDIRLNAMSAADYLSPAPCFAFKEALGMSLL